MITLTTSRSLLLAFLLTVTATGCSSSAQEPTPAAPDSTAAPDTAVAVDPATPADTTTPEEPAVAATAKTVGLDIVTFDELQAIIASHKGKVVVVDYWSTSCEPCVTEFPYLVELSQQYPADQVVCISASLDYEGLKKFPVEKVQETTLEFLQEQKAMISNFIFSEDSLTILD